MAPTARLSGAQQQALAALATGAAVVGADWPGDRSTFWLWLEVFHGVVCATLVVAGLRLSRRPGQLGNGRLLIASGLLSLVAGTSWLLGPTQVIAWVAGTAVALPLAWLLLRYPGNRIIDTYDRRFVAMTFVLVVGLRLVETPLWDPSWADYHGPGWWPTLVHNESLHSAVIGVMYCADIVVGLVLIWLLLRRHSRNRGLGRLQAVPLLVAGIIGSLAFGVLDATLRLISFEWLHSFSDTANKIVNATEGAAVLGIIGAFAVAALLARLQRARVTQLLTDIDAEHDPVALQSSLRSVLSDTELLVLLRDADTGWLDVAGEAVDLTGGRSVVPVNATAALLVDRDVTDQVDLLTAVVRASQLAMDNARLQALAQARLEEVTRSRERLAQVGLEERRRLERDLHDGAQQQLLSVAAGIAGARAATKDPVMHQRLDDVRDGLRAALAELRDLAHGIHPAVLTQSGLGAAVESAVDRLGLVARLRFEPRRWPPAVEAAAYFVTSEALANAVKHSAAALIDVEAHSVGNALMLSVRDDGCGGAVASGGGLTGMRDRVTALGGTLTVTSPPGEGTTITARFPCD